MYFPNVSDQFVLTLGAGLSFKHIGINDHNDE